MTKPKEKTCEELQAEIEDGKKKIRQLENREKMLRQIRKKCLSPAKKHWCQTVRPAKGVQSDRWKSCQISC